MTETKGKKALSLCILRVLEQHASERDPLSTRRIIDYLKDDFGMIAERKAVGRNLILLAEMENTGWGAALIEVLREELDTIEQKLSKV